MLLHPNLQLIRVQLVTCAARSPVAAEANAEGSLIAAGSLLADGSCTAGSTLAARAALVAGSSTFALRHASRSMVRKSGSTSSSRSNSSSRSTATSATGTDGWFTASTLLPVLVLMTRPHPSGWWDRASDHLRLHLRTSACPDDKTAPIRMVGRYLKY